MKADQDNSSNERYKTIGASDGFAQEKTKRAKVAKLDILQGTAAAAVATGDRENSTVLQVDQLRPTGELPKLKVKSTRKRQESNRSQQPIPIDQKAFATVSGDRGFFQKPSGKKQRNVKNQSMIDSELSERILPKLEIRRQLKQ